MNLTYQAALPAWALEMHLLKNSKALQAHQAQQSMAQSLQKFRTPITLFVVTGIGWS